MDEKNEGLTFWYGHLGRYLSNAEIERAAKAAVPTRMKSGVGDNPLGAMIDAYYIVTPDHAWVLGLIDMPDTDRVTFVATDGPARTNPRRFIAEWLVERAQAPFMVGLIGNANPNGSFEVSGHPARGIFCEAGKSFRFNLENVRHDAALIGRDMTWRDLVPALAVYEAFASAEPGAPDRERARETLTRVLKKTPRLRAILPKIMCRPESGDRRILAWLLG